jgi:serine/threonine protein kinase/tetratricopeptide (TPR) repeat protein
MTTDFEGTERFQVLRHLGAGGMGDVYEAHDKERNTHVALKLLTKLTPDRLLRFKREFRNFQDLSHPNLVNLGELFSSGRHWFFSMELVPDAVSFLQHVRPGSAGFSGGVMETMPAAAVNSPAPTDSRSPSLRGTLNESRLRSALRQLAIGLCALHDAGKVHRDIKPSNVVVDSSGRVVILDFGVSTDIVRKPGESMHIFGTPQYMAPEQAEGAQVGPAADWYSVGVVLFEALTGQLPLSGSPMELIRAKRLLDGLSPKRVQPDAPDDLAALCSELLRYEPSERLSGRKVLERLGAEELLSFGAAESQPNFIGRDGVIQILHEQLIRRDDARVVLVHGESGVGKTTLVQHFVAREQEREPELVALIGTCYERESVPFKAVDGLVDAVSQYLRRLRTAEAAAALPRRASLLAHVFPVLLRVEAIAEMPAFTAEGLDSLELRKQIFAALRELLARLADRHPVVVVIDDLQWADVDSLALLAEVLRSPDAPNLLLVATVRSDLGPTAEEWQQRLGRADVVHLSLERMSRDESYALAESLVRREGASALDPAALAEEASGHPLMITELVRHAVALGTSPTAHLQLDDALLARIGQLDDDARRVLELVALGARRLTPKTVAAAASLPLGDCVRHIELLRKVRLVRTSGTHGGDAVEPYHNRVGKAVLAKMSPQMLSRLHRRLALALEASGQSDPGSVTGGMTGGAALAHHWREAGDRTKAAHHTQFAAEKATRAFAFDRAAAFYQEAVSLLGENAPNELHIRCADALVRAGRGADAATEYLRAAGRVPPAERLDLQRRAGEQLLRCGHIDKGLDVFQEVQNAVGMPLAKTPTGAFMAWLLRRSRLWIRGLRYRARDESQISRAELSRIDAGLGMALALSLVDGVRAADLGTRVLLLALESGEPYRIAIALAWETLFYGARVGAAGQKRTKMLQESIDELANRIDHPHALGLARWAAGTTAYAQGRFRESVEQCELALQIFRERCSGVAWEVATANAFMLWSRFYCGEIAEISRRLPVLLESARARGDLFDAANLRASHSNIVWLAADRPQEARLQIGDALRNWSSRGFHLQHFYELFGIAQNDIYVGDGEAAWKRVTEGWPNMKASFLLQFQTLRVEMHSIRARAALAVASNSPPSRGERTTFASFAERDAKHLAGEGAAWAEALSLLIRAQVVFLRGDLEASAALLRQSVESFERRGMALYAAVARRHLGLLIQGDEGAALVATSDAWMTSEGIQNRRRMAHLLAPGFVVR